MAEQPKPTPWKDWPDLLAPKDLVELMPGFIGQKRAYSIARQIGRRYGRSYVIKKEDFFDWITGGETLLEETEGGRIWKIALQPRK